MRGPGSSESSDPSSSDDEKSDEDNNEDSDASGDDAVKGAPAKKKPMGSKFLRTAKGGDDSSSDEDEDESDQEIVKVVKSAKSKKLDEMEAIEKSIGNGQRISDWANVNTGRLRFHSSFHAHPSIMSTIDVYYKCIIFWHKFLCNLLVEYDKLSRLSAPLPGSTSSLLPPVILRVILSLEESLGSASTGANVAGGKKSKMNATSARALTALKQKIKKAMRENETILAEYKTVSPARIFPFAQ